MVDLDLEYLANEVVTGMLDEFDDGTGEPFEAHLDIARENIHDSKKEFLAEAKAVESTLTHARKTLTSLRPDGSDTDKSTKAMKDRLHLALDIRARKEAPRLAGSGTAYMVVKNASEQDFCRTSIFLIIQLIEVLRHRQTELEQQRELFWNTSGRSPSHYGRTIALRLAKLYLDQTGKLPTYGTARDGAHPSTRYSKALEKIFKILGVSAKARHAGEWAVNELRDETQDGKNR